MAQPAIQVEGLGKMYSLDARPKRAHEVIERSVRSALRLPVPEETEPFWAVKDCTFTIQQGDVVGLMGRNGAGKSVLLKMLSRIVKPTTGSAEIRGRLASLLELGSGFHPEMTGRENVYLNGTVLGLTRPQLDERFEEIVEFSGIRKFLDVPVKRYSSGMTTRLAFSIAAHVEADIMLIDEVLAVGDSEFQEKCLAHIHRVTGSGVTVLIVSHAVVVVRELCTRGLYLSAGRLVVDGSMDEAAKAYIDHR